MKDILTGSLFILVTTAVAFVSCSKDDERVSNNYISNPPPPPPPPPPNPGKTIKGRIIEYNSGLPIAGATISLRPDYPNMNTITLTSDQTGATSFISSTHNIGYISVNKAGYWNLDPNYDLACGVLFYPDTTQFARFINTNEITCDSFVVKLFKVWNIAVHIKDTAESERNTGITIHGMYNVNGTEYKRYGDWIVFPPGIDTTFQLPVFGNANNKFGIWKSYDDDYFIWEEISNQVQYITYGTNTTVNIFY
jgi:hypothetical protein